MSEWQPTNYDISALAECHEIGLHPTPHPLGEAHHTDIPMTMEDQDIGVRLSYFLGTLFADVDGKDSRYWYYERTSTDEWSRVARALRLHGLRIVDAT